MAGPKSVVENEAFVNMMAAALEDDGVRNKLLGLLQLDAFQRASALNTFLDEMRLQGAPANFIEAVAYLKDDAIAEEALRVLRKKGE
jgi:hypothetical protein